MGTKSSKVIRVLHLSTAHSWRGGENQIYNLLRSSPAHFELCQSLICHPHNPLLAKARTLNIPAFPVNFHGEWDILKLFPLFNLLNKLKPHIIHSHDSHALSFGCLLKMFMPSLKHVTSRRVDFHTHKNPPSFFKYHIGSDVIIAISEGIREVLLENGINPRKIVTIRSGIHFESFDEVGPGDYLYTDLPISREDILVINVASLAPHKAQNILIEAASLVTRANPRVKFLIVGDGPLYSKLKDQIIRTGLTKKVILTGFRKDIPELLKASKIFVLSSYLEGLGTSLLEAMRMKLPIVATRVGGIPEIVRHSVNGLLIPPYDPAALANAILNLLSNPEKARQMGEEGFQITNAHSAKNTAEKNYQVYYNLCHPA
ncbi:glycosyltransferase family 4 protein [bacterium]|nr:glycosyltransferase family 4 protein [bacterium]